MLHIIILVTAYQFYMVINALLVIKQFEQAYGISSSIKNIAQQLNGIAMVEHLIINNHGLITLNRFSTMTRLDIHLLHQKPGDVVMFYSGGASSHTVTIVGTWQDLILK